VLIKTKYNQGTTKLTPQLIEMRNWLDANQLGTNEIINVFQQQKINLENMKYLKDSDLISFGITDWNIRMSILDSIQKYFAMSPMLGFGNLSDHSISFPSTSYQYIQPQTIQSQTPHVGTKRKMEDQYIDNLNPSKKLRTSFNRLQKPKVKYKDLEALVLNPSIPVDIGTIVQCSDSTVVGTVDENKHKKPIIKYMIDGNKLSGTISQFYKNTTGKPLQEKGESWSNIFFTQGHSGISRSLEDIKYLDKGPKKVISAYLFFAKEVRDTVPKTEDFAKNIGELWRNLPENEKQKYKSLEKLDKIRYSKEKAEHAILVDQNSQ